MASTPFFKFGVLSTRARDVRRQVEGLRKIDGGEEGQYLRNLRLNRSVGVEGQALRGLKGSLLLTDVSVAEAVFVPCLPRRNDEHPVRGSAW